MSVQGNALLNNLASAADPTAFIRENRGAAKAVVAELGDLANRITDATREGAFQNREITPEQRAAAVRRSGEVEPARELANRISAEFGLNASRTTPLLGLGVAGATAAYFTGFFSSAAQMATSVPFVGSALNATRAFNSTAALTTLTTAVKAVSMPTLATVGMGVGGVVVALYIAKLAHNHFQK